LIGGSDFPFPTYAGYFSFLRVYPFFSFSSFVSFSLSTFDLRKEIAKLSVGLIAFYQNTPILLAFKL